uniref:mandelate racemase/muconate lactonizing enzyme family protein n=1 Tax=Pararhizobium sp. IMCC3301 TaxID=3067904 RepID=UPI00274185D0|nr:mandelate racemase/muconate lactonizing enzyme family protein [Pararhizobium sp. IMCC3301]
MSEFTVQFVPVTVTPATIWLFVSLSDGETVGWGEATLENQEATVTDCFNALPKRLTEADLADLRFDTLPQAALSSALRQAQADLAARMAGVSLSDHLGRAGRDQIGIYANINRSTRDRSPEGMASNARRALAHGHNAIKVAPFDEVRATMGRREMTDAMGLGLARIAAVRDVVGERRLMVDCHWRFDVAGAGRLIDACAPLKPYWIECPILETEAGIAELVSLRRRANAAGMRLAGLETAILRQGFAPYLAAGAYDVMMPDVKYCGGPREMLAISVDMARHGVAFSPHNPSGPICHMHSMHICASLPQEELLETQFDETPMFDSLVDQALPQPIGGRVTLPMSRLGLGLSLVVPQPESGPST